jgi:hypothetical protein
MSAGAMVRSSKYVPLDTTVPGGMRLAPTAATPGIEMASSTSFL